MYMQPDQDQYGFIMNPGTGPQKRSMLPGFGTMSKKQLLIFGGAGVLILAMLVTILFSLLSGGPTNKDQLLAVVAQQNELIRISDIAVKEARGIEAKNLAMTTKLSLRSDQSSLTAALKAQNVKVGGKDLQAAKDSDTDRLLEDAKQNNRFDEVYLEFIQAALVEYQKNLNTAYKTTISPQLKEAMKIQYQNASIIIGVDPEV